MADGGAFHRASRLRNPRRWWRLTPTSLTRPWSTRCAAGFAHLHTTRFGPDRQPDWNPGPIRNSGNPSGRPRTADCPTSTFGNLTNLGSNNFLPSDEVSATLQVTDDFTKIYGKHSFKMGVEYQHVKFSTLQPAWSRGALPLHRQVHRYSEPGQHHMAAWRRCCCRRRRRTAVRPARMDIDYSGGSDGVYASNINKTYDAENVLAPLLPGRLEDDVRN